MDLKQLDLNLLLVFNQLLAERSVSGAARALGLDFVPLARERYDIVIPAAHMDDARVQAMLALLRDERFLKRVEAMGGYETTLSGRLMERGMGLEG